MEADAKEMGGYLSHEYHYLDPIGEAKLQNCRHCQHYSIDATEKANEQFKCPKCNTENVEKHNGIEV